MAHLWERAEDAVAAGLELFDQAAELVVVPRGRVRPAVQVQLDLVHRAVGVHRHVGLYDLCRSEKMATGDP